MLLKNERLVLQHLVNNARTSDLTISKEIGISTQAVGKIRKKLEESGVIKSYNLRLNPEAIGLNTICLLAVMAPPDIIEREDKFREEITKELNVIDCYRLLHGNANFFIVFAFRDLKESEEYFKKFYKKYPRIIVANLQASTWDLVWKNTKKDAYMYALQNKTIDEALKAKGKN